MKGSLDFHKTVNETKNPISNGLDVCDKTLRAFASKYILKNLDGRLRVTYEIGSVYNKSDISKKSEFLA